MNVVFIPLGLSYYIQVYSIRNNHNAKRTTLLLVSVPVFVMYIFFIIKSKFKIEIMVGHMFRFMTFVITFIRASYCICLRVKNISFYFCLQFHMISQLKNNNYNKIKWYNEELNFNYSNVLNKMQHLRLKM